LLAQFRSGLFRRIFAATTALAIFIIVSAISLSTMEYEERIRAETALRHAHMAQRMALEIGYFFQYSRLQMEMFAGFLKYYDPKDHELNAMLNQISLDMPHMVEITITGSSGANGNGVSTKVDLDANRIPRLELSVPVLYRGQVVNTVKARLSLKHLWLWIDEINIDPETNLIVAKTDSGLVIADQKKELIGKIYPGLAGRTSGISAGPSGQPVYRSFHDFPELGVLIITSTVIPSSSDHMYRARYRLLAMALGLTALAALLSYLFSARTVRPVNALIEAMNRYAQKGERIAEPLEGEYKSIAHAFNKVADTLEANRKAMVAQESLVTLGRVAAILTHELRHGLQSISNEVYLMEAGRENKEKLNKIVASLASQVSSIMELARGSQVETCPEEAGRILEEARDIMALNGYSREVNISIQENGPGPLYLLADRRKIIAALSNLVRNSMEAKAANVRLEARREGDMAIIEVSDDGDGFDPSMREKILEPFVTTKERGFGLGLAFVKSVAIAHGGWFVLDAGQGGGSVARIYLPVKEAERK